MTIWNRTSSHSLHWRVRMFMIGAYACPPAAPHAERGIFITPASQRTQLQ
jgi:hypothetical protein